MRDILAVDLAQPMLDALAQRFPPPSTLGNEPGVSSQHVHTLLAGAERLLRCTRITSVWRMTLGADSL